MAIDPYDALRAAGVPRDKARASATAIGDASRVNTKLNVLMWVGGSWAGGTIAGFALMTTQVTRLTGGVVCDGGSRTPCRRGRRARRDGPWHRAERRMRVWA